MAKIFLSLIKIFKTSTLAILVFFTFAFALSISRATAETNSLTPTSSEVVITLEKRSLSPKVSPNYKLILFEDGLVVFDGMRGVKGEGIRKTMVARKKVKELIKYFKKIDYFSLKDRYTMSINCKKYERGKGSIITSITINGKTKRVDHDLGCLDAPPLLNGLESKIDQVAESQKLIHGALYSSPKKQEITKTLNSPVETKNTIFSLKTRGCYGTCPIYQLVVFGDGQVIYEGIRFVEKTGIFRWKISSNKAQEIFSEYKKLIQTTQRQTVSDRKECLPDAPSSETYLILKNKKISFPRELECTGDNSLVDFEKNVNKILGISDWIKQG